MTDTVKLRAAVSASGLKYKHIAEVLGLSPYGLQKKVDGQNEFKASEIAKLSEILNLSPDSRNKIFFASC